ncbi:MAG: hypothetical protein A2340_09445 [Lentisphaerae bacterium RIFOXYB12_FULL_60_10]|nr:MAG: hypothetical protein A2340_09445 [Lentisphaerae bacterium RIFOXYB12_FULL_60_10]
MVRADPLAGLRAHSKLTQHQFWETESPCFFPGRMVHCLSPLSWGSQNGSMMASASLKGVGFMILFRLYDAKDRSGGDPAADMIYGIVSVNWREL